MVERRSVFSKCVNLFHFMGYKACSQRATEAAMDLEVIGALKA